MEDNYKIPSKPKTAREFLSSRYFWRPFLSIVIGGIAGFSYYYFVGCSSGTCSITSSPYMSTLGGSLLGLFMVNSPCSAGKC